MKLAISNIAWTADEDDRAAELMVAYGIAGVEIAPSRVWTNPADAPEERIVEHRTFWNARGIRVAALQALLYGRPDLTIFDSLDARRTTATYVGRMFRIAELLGAQPLVFGSPCNRQVGNRPAGEVAEIARMFFGELGTAAAVRGVVLCIEPNPTVYDCDYVTTAREGLALVYEVDSRGFGLHLDAGGMALNDEPPEQTIHACADVLSHFHVSEPQLAAVGEGVVDHAAHARALREIGYQGWVSIEMRRDPARGIDERLEPVLQFVRETYGP